MQFNNNDQWDIDYLDFEQQNWRIRIGKFKSVTDTPVRGRILYLQGLSDSFRNHEPFFSRLAENGFEVIAFDYPGQGGSSGSMNQLRILPASAASSIANLAEQVWQYYFPDQKQLDTVVGWSTGGLAAYELAYRQKCQRVIMIAPGLGIKKLLDGKLITQTNGFTQEDYTQTSDPHIDPFKPKSPLLVPLFSSHLLMVDQQARHWLIPDNINGLVCLSGEHDPYVHSDKTLAFIQKNAANFIIKNYPNALHEIDNEIGEIREAFYKDVVNFLTH